MSQDLRDNYDLGILAGVAQERERFETALYELLVSLHGAYPPDYGLVATLRQLIKGEQK